MSEINQANSQRSSDAVPATQTGLEENKTGQPAPPVAAEANVSSPPDASPPASRFDQRDKVERPAPAPATPRAAKPALPRWLLWLAGGAVALAVAAYFLVPWVVTTRRSASPLLSRTIETVRRTNSDLRVLPILFS
jgi:hypothetical protein